MKELKEGELSKEDEATLQAGICPVCGSQRWAEGPSGGLAVNIACASGHRFWVAGPFTPEYQGVIKVEDHVDGTFVAYF